MIRSKLDVQHKFMKAALDLFLMHGFDQTSVREIASAAGYTERTFFRYFKDKREVLFFGQEDIETQLKLSLANASPSESMLHSIEKSFTFLDDLYLSESKKILRRRKQVIDSNPTLKERDLYKFSVMSKVITEALVASDVKPETAMLAANISISILKIAVDKLLEKSNKQALSEITRDLFERISII